MTKQILVNVEDVLTILVGMVEVSISALNTPDESSGVFGDVVFTNVEKTLDIFEKVAKENGINVGSDGLRSAFEKFNAS